MSAKKTTSADRDELDAAIAQTRAAARTPHGLPAPDGPAPDDVVVARYAEGSATPEEADRVLGAMKQNPLVQARGEILQAALA